MAAIAALDPAAERELEELERDTGAWLVAYAPTAASEPPPGYAGRLRPAHLDQQTLDKLRRLEQRTGSVIVAYEPALAA